MPVAICPQIYISVCGNPQSGYLIHSNPRSKHCGLPPSAVYIWAWSLARDWNPAPAILYRQFPCLLHHKFLTRDFLYVRLIRRGGMLRPKLCTHMASVDTPSRDTIPLKAELHAIIIFHRYLWIEAAEMKLYCGLRRYTVIAFIVICFIFSRVSIAIPYVLYLILSIFNYLYNLQ
jgi:hypothetical protein